MEKMHTKFSHTTNRLRQNKRYLFQGITSKKNMFAIRFNTTSFDVSANKEPIFHCAQMRHLFSSPCPIPCLVQVWTRLNVRSIICHKPNLVNFLAKIKGICDNVWTTVLTVLPAFVNLYSK